MSRHEKFHAERLEAETSVFQAQQEFSRIVEQIRRENENAEECRRNFFLSLIRQYCMANAFLTANLNFMQVMQAHDLVPYDEDVLRAYDWTLKIRNNLINSMRYFSRLNGLDFKAAREEAELVLKGDSKGATFKSTFFGGLGGVAAGTLARFVLGGVPVAAATEVAIASTTAAIFIPLIIGVGACGIIMWTFMHYDRTEDIVVRNYLHPDFDLSAKIRELELCPKKAIREFLDIFLHTLHTWLSNNQKYECDICLSVFEVTRKPAAGPCFESAGCTARACLGCWRSWFGARSDRECFQCGRVCAFRSIRELPCSLPPSSW